MHDRKSAAIVLLVLIIMMFTLASSCGRIDYPAQTEPPGPGFYALFNGRDFSGWDIGVRDPGEGAWRVENALIYCKGEPRAPYLILTEKEYENFEFYGEFMVSEECNSGIFYHIPLAGRQSRLGFETQILDDCGKPPDKNSTGAIYDVVPPLVNAMKSSGTWNQYRLLFDWPLCRIWLNGKLVQDTDFSAHPQLKYRLRRGPIGLSNHGYSVWYRNLWIRELPDRDEKAVAFNGNDLTGWTVQGDADWHVEDGAIVSTRGSGYLVCEREGEGVYFHAYVDSDTLHSREARIYYRWMSTDDPGYTVDLYDYRDAVRYVEQYGDDIPPDIIGPMDSPWFLYRIISNDRQSAVYLNEHLISQNKLLGKPPRGKIAFYRGKDDGIIRIKGVKMREIEGPGI